MSAWIHPRVGTGGAEAWENKLVSTATSISAERASLCNLLQGLSPLPNRHLCIPETRLGLREVHANLPYSTEQILSGCLHDHP